MSAAELLRRALVWLAAFAVASIYAAALALWWRA